MCLQVPTASSPTMETAPGASGRIPAASSAAAKSAATGSFAPNWLIGIQGSGSGADIKDEVLDPFFGPPNQKQFHARTDWLADVTGRLGVVWDRFMLYGKGGVAGAGDKYNVSETMVTCDAGAVIPCTYDASETRTGFVVGAGVEWAFWNNCSVFLEYDFYGFVII